MPTGAFSMNAARRASLSCSACWIVLSSGDLGDRGEHRRPAAEGDLAGGQRHHRALPSRARISTSKPSTRPSLGKPCRADGPIVGAGVERPDRVSASSPTASPKVSNARALANRISEGSVREISTLSGTPSAIARKRSSRSWSSTCAGLRSLMSVTVTSIASWPRIMMARAERIAHMVMPSVRRRRTSKPSTRPSWNSRSIRRLRSLGAR